MASLGQLIKRWRTPLLLGGGGLVALTAWQRAASAQQAAAVAASTPAGAPSALSPEQVAALIGQGNSASLAAVQAGLGPTDRALDLAGLLGQGALSAVSGNFSDLAGLAGQALGILPSFAPVEGVTPQPTTQPPASTPTQPAPSAPTEVFAGYYAVTSPGVATIFTVNSAGAITGQRQFTFLGGRAQVRRSTSSLLHWRYTGGSIAGWSLIPGRSGSFRIQKLYRRSDGTQRWVDIGQTGS